MTRSGSSRSRSRKLDVDVDAVAYSGKRVAETHGAAAQRGFDTWHTAMRWQRGVDRALRPLGLTHSRYLVLDAAARLVAEQRDACAQRAVAARAGLDASTTSSIAFRLTEDGLLDRGPNSVDARRWRLFVTRRGEDLLKRAREVIDDVAAHLVDER